jgi:hypothetical protein
MFNETLYEVEKVVSVRWVKSKNGNIPRQAGVLHQMEGL